MAGQERGAAPAWPGGVWLGAEGGSFGLGKVPPSHGSLCTIAPGAGCLGKPFGFPLSDQSLVPLSSRPSLRLFSRLVRFSASVDHQMTPALFAGLSGPSALPSRSLADRLLALPSVALVPCDSRGVPDMARGGGRALRVMSRTFWELRATRGVAPGVLNVRETLPRGR